MSLLSKYRVEAGRRFHLNAVDPDDCGDFESKARAAEATLKSVDDLDALQERLFAEGTRSMLIVLQGIDSSGKDGTIRHVMTGINPQGCQVTSFKVPTPEERQHDFLWRVHQHVPAKGYIGIFNRSHYEDVIVTRVHDLISKGEAKRRCRDINDFERILVQNGTTVLKFYLAISKAEQRRRLQQRLDDPTKHWKFNADDLKERQYWTKYSKAFADAIQATSTDHAPWFVIPANHKWYRNYLVATIMAKALKDMNPKYPPGPKGLKKIKIGA